MRNEVEERRVIRLLASLGDDVPALGDDEIERLMRSAPVAPRRVRSRRPARGLPAVAAAAVVALAFLVQFERAEHSQSASPGSASIASFPEGNALQLLLSASETR